MSDDRDQIRLIIVDDHPIVRTGLRWMIETAPEVDLVGEATNGETALTCIGDMQPDVVLMDLYMPGMGEIEAIKHIRQHWPQIAVIILTNYNDDQLMLQGLRAGARGYLLKDVDLSTLLRAIQTAARGEALIQPNMMERILALIDPPVASLRSQRAGDLTEREIEVLTHVARGERSKEIAASLGVTERTVTSYLTTIYTKLGVDSRASAVAVAMEWGILPRHREPL